jgi:aryl-alcohol dehydrogenase-like predicted oxidoreductase
MKRRHFFGIGAGSAAAIGSAGCSGLKNYNFEPEYAGMTWGMQSLSEPSNGSMGMKEIGTTGIKVSNLCFGSHMPIEAVPYERFRQKLIRDAYSCGINFFDVYDEGQDVYQYEPMGRHLAPMINDVVISIVHRPYNGRTSEEEMERVLRLFKRDHIDLVRGRGTINSPVWDTLFRMKEKGYIRAVGMSTHEHVRIQEYVDKLPLDYMLFPYNFHQNIAYANDPPDDFVPLTEKCRSKGMGILTMKAFCGDYLATPFDKISLELVGRDGPRFCPAALRYVLNSGIEADSTYVGMYTYTHLNQNLTAFYNKNMTAEEKELLAKLDVIAEKHAHAWLPGHYKWLTNWRQNTMTQHA